MIPPIFTICAAASGVTALLGTKPVRLFPFGEAPEKVAAPYAVWQLVGGAPENYLGTLPDLDLLPTQVDVYGDSAASVLAVAAALRTAIEPHAHITRWRGQTRDAETGRYRFSFDVDWFVPR